MEAAIKTNANQMEGTERLRSRLQSAQRDGVSFAAISASTGVSRTAISMFVNRGLTPGQDKLDVIRNYLDTQDIETELEQLTDKILVAEPRKRKTAIEIYETSEYREAMGWCNYMRDKRKMGVMIGYPGSGKTTILRQFGKIAAGTIYVDCWPTMRLGDMIRLLASELGISVKGSQYERIMQIVANLSVRNDVMLIFDEAENLRDWSVKKFDVLRKIWDNTSTPVILCGTQKLEDTLTTGGGRDNLAQLYRRKYEIRLGGISAEEVLGILRDYDITAEAANKLTKIATDVKHGGMGNFVELLDMALEAAEGGTIDEAIVKGAMQYKMMY